MNPEPNERILVVEDEPDILEMLEYNLTRAGYRVSGARDGEEALERARLDQPDLVLLDLMLPRLDGLEVCRRLRQDPATHKTPIIMVTAKGQEDDVVAGLEAGADDYIAKPFGVKVVMARVKAVLRRKPAPSGERVVVRGGLIVDADRHEVSIDGVPAQLTATEFRVLHTLVSQPGRVYTRSQLVDKIMGPLAMVGDRNIDVHIGAVRKKLGPYRDLLVTVRGVGYRFKA